MSPHDLLPPLDFTPRVGGCCCLWLVSCGVLSGSSGAAGASAVSLRRGAVSLRAPSPLQRQPYALRQKMHFSTHAWPEGESQRPMLLPSIRQPMRLADVPAVTTAAAHS